MKRFLGILSLIIVVGTEVLTPITYANDLVLNEEVYQSVDSNISDIPENDNVAGDQNNVSGDNNFSDNTDEDTGEQGSLSPEGEENDETVEQTETDEKDNQEQTETGKSDTQEQTGTNSVTATEDEQGTDTVQCEDAILHGIYDEECVFQEKCEDGYNLEENECVLSEDVGSDLGENEETVEENKEGESSSAVVVEDTDFSFIDSLSDIAKEIIGGLRYFFTRDSDSFIKYSTSGDEGIIVLIDPENGDSMTIMDKNLGAESTSEEDEKSYGNYYQWGSNNGISGDKIADFIENEEVNSTGDWNGDDEEIQGPCPTGYHIPTQNEWTSLVNVWRKIHTQDVRENVDDEGTSTVIRKTRSTKGSILLTSLEKCNEGDIEVEGKCIAENEISGLESLFMSDLKLPKAGSYLVDGEYRNGVGSYWTITPSENVTTQSEIFSIDKYFGKGIYDDEKDRTSWHNVRCFLDTKVKEKVVENNLNKEEIVGELEHDGVVVKVIAPVSSFYEGAEPRIKVITEDDGLDDVKDEIADSQDNVSKESKMVAFDISFMYKVGTGEIEVQPVEGKAVKVLFDYKLNDDFLNAETDENQEVKVFHLEETKETTEEDIDSEQGEIVEEVKTTVVDVTNEAESVGTGLIVADGESFSIYAIVTVSQGIPDSVQVIHDLNGGYWVEDGDTTSKPITYTKVGNVYTTTTHYRTPSNTGFMFMGWYDQSLSTRWIGNDATSGMTVYAKWQEFGDLNVYILNNDENKYQYTLMDRNMGATGVYDKSLTINPESRGRYYQWGNNYGFDSKSETPGALSNTTGKQINTNGFSWETPYYSSIFYTSKDKGEWTTALNKDLWGDGTIKTNESKQGPCPAGYHIPSKDDWQGLLRNWEAVNNRENKNFYFDFLIPSAGIRDRGYSKSAEVVDIERYRYASSSRDGTTFDKKAVIVLTQTTINGIPIVSNGTAGNTAHEHAANGLSLRCIKNVTDSTLNVSNIDLNGGTGGIISIASGVVSSIQAPKRGNDRFEGWYTNDEYLGEPIDSENDVIPEGTTGLYAKWNCSTGFVNDGDECVEGFNIMFNANGGTTNATDIVVTGSDASKTINMSDYTAEKPGYYFVGWNTNSGASTGLQGEQTFTEDTILYAIFLKLYTYRFEDVNGTFLGTGYYESGVVMDMTKLIPLNYYTEGKVGDITLYDDLFTLGLTDQEKDNFGRKWTPDLPEQGIATGDLVITGEKLELFDLTFLRSVGVDFLKYRLLSGTIFDEPEEYPRESGLQFVGWYEEDDLDTRIDFPIIITGDITLYPKFLNVYCSFITDNSEFGGVKITGFSGEQSQECLNNFVVPREIDGFDVVEIADNSFNGDSADAQIISGEINLPDTIRRIGKNAFMNNNISSGEFRFPKNITHLEAQAFYGNRISGTIKFPGTIESKIMGSAFRCNFVEKVVIGTGIVQVNQDAYNTTPCPDRATLTSVEFPSTLTKISKGAFYGQNIQGVDLPDGLTSIEASAFYNNSISGELVLPSSLTTIDSLAFYNNNISGTLVIPGSISTVTTAFRCNPIREVVFGEGVKKIDHSAFSSDLGNNVCPEGKGRTIKSIDLPDSLKEIGENAFLSQKIEGEFVFPASLTKLGLGAFKNNNISGTLRIPGNYVGQDGTGVVNGAFKCNLIEKVIFSEGIRIIGDQAFYGNDVNCSQEHFTIKSVEFPSTLTGINYNAFRDHQISSVTIGENVEKIGHNAFDNQHDSSGFTLKTVLLRGGTTLENNAFISNDMESIYIPDSIESFGTDVFKSSGNTYITGYVTTKKSTLNYTGAYIKPVYQLYTYTFVDETGTVLGTGYYPEILESNTTKLIPLDYYNGIGDINTFTGADSLINPGVGHAVRWSTELSENSVVTQNLVVTGTIVGLHSVTFKNPFTGDIVKQVAHNETVERPVDYIKAGFEFDGWYSGDTKFVFTTPIVSDLVLTGVYIPIKYQLSFYSDRNKTELLSGILYDFNAEVQTQPIADPTKTDYDFLGWKAITGDYDISFPLTMTGDLEVYANWESPKYEHLTGWDGCYKYETYTGTSDNQFYAEILEYSGGNSCLTENLTMPNIITRNGRLYTIKRLGEGSFYNKGLSGEITLPTSLEAIGNGALHSNSYITSVNISEGLVSIGDAPFAYDTRLKEINLPNTLKVIGGGAFYSGGLDHITIPSSVEVISGGAFQNNRLSSITILGNSLREIGDYAFNGSTVTGVRLPDSLETLGNKAFCTSNGTNTGSIVGILTSSANVENRIAQLSGSHDDTCLDLKKSSYVIKFVNYNGSELQSSNVNYEELPVYNGGTPTKPATPEHTFTFAGWNPTIVEATEDAVYTATYNSNARQYTITFNNDDGTELLSDEYAYGTLAENIVQPTNPTKTGNTQYNYTFAGWSSEVANVTEDAVYTATYDSNINQYTIIFNNDDGVEIARQTLNYGSGIVAPTATKPATAEFTYEFSGWIPELPEGATVLGDAVYTASYTTTTNTYDIIWKNEDGTVLETDENVEYGETPHYNGTTPQKARDAHYSYVFAGWTPEVTSVAGDATYTAKYTPVVNKYTVTFVDDDGSEKLSGQYDYGTAATDIKKPANPTKDPTAQYTYSFARWTPELVEVTENAVYTAVYNSVVNQYTIIFNDEDGTGLGSGTYDYGTESGAITVPEEPTKERTAQYTFTFAGWTPSIAEVTADATYTATYSSTVNKYTITFKDGDEESSSTYTYQTATGDLQIPNRSKTGHTLVWQPDLSPVVQDQVYTASYVRNSYKVSTLAETGVDHIDGSGTYLYEAEVTFTGYAKTGYHFDDGDTVLTHTFNVPAYDSIVKMNANPNIYKVRYLKNGGVGTAMADQTFTYDETGVLAVNTFVKTGSYFKGWLDEDNNMYSDGQEVINLTGEDNGIVLLIAQWSDTAKHTLKVIDTDGSVLQTKLYSSGDIISLDTPTKKGYLFVEWTNYPENGLMPDKDVIIGVVWKVNPDDQGQSSGQAGGGGGRIVPREDKVIIPEEEHGAAQESGSQEVVQPKETDKDNDLSLTLYQWAYKYGITTKREDESNPDGVLLRGHMAKIIVNYVVNVLGRKEPKVIPDRCSFIDNEIDWKSEEIKQYSKRACALGLMGINVETFNPNAVVTRAQFGTVLSRVLWGDTYNLTGASYYDLHLKALKRKGIMTKIEHPINVVEIRKWAWLMLRRAYEDYEIKD